MRDKFRNMQKKENTFEEFKIQQYQSCFYNIIQEYYKNELLKEKK